MKTIFIKSLCLILLAMAGMTASAQKFEVDGIHYEVISEDDMAVTITGYDNGNHISSVVIPDRVAHVGKVYSVTSISNGAFSGASFASVHIPNTVTFIGEGAFRLCGSLSSITIPSNVLLIGDHAFSECGSLKEILVEDSNTRYASADGALYDKDLSTLICCPGGKESVSIPNTTKSIADRAFYWCRKLISVEIPESVTSIGEYAFDNCSNLSTIDMPNSVKLLSSGAFLGCSSLTHINIDSVTTIDSQVFSVCSSLKSISMKSVTSIGDEAFYQCQALESVDIPSGVTYIGNYAFYGCYSLKSVYCHWSDPLECRPEFEEEALFFSTLYVPDGTVDRYRAVEPWSEFFNIEEGGYSGIGDATATGQAITVKDGAIVITGGGTAASAPLVEIYSAGGVCIWRGTETVISGLPQGIYVVKAGDTVQKVAL